MSVFFYSLGGQKSKIKADLVSGGVLFAGSKWCHLIVFFHSRRGKGTFRCFLKGSNP